jgi:1,4-dihydroxy-2-naphthoyl-CoA hydrolase
MTDSQANRDKTYPVSEIPLGAMAERMGVILLEASINRIVCQMPVEGNTQPFGLLNGGASMALAETLGSIGANLFAGPDRVAVGIDINGTHHRSATEGLVTGVATPLSLGRTLAVYEIVISDQRDKRLCTARITCLLRDRS